MGSIRKQTIISSLLVYFGFFIGAINIFFYTKIGNQHGAFTAEQFGLTRIFFDYAQNMYAFSSLGIIPIIYKFYPYYKDNLEEHEIDLMSWAMVTALFGFILILIAGFYFEPLFVKQFSVRSKLIVDYYYWMFPFAMGMLFFSVIEGFCWGIQKTVISNFLKETGLRIFTLILILLFYFKWITFDSFIKIFAFLYLAIFLILAIYLYRTKRLHFPFKMSRVTKKFKKKIIGMQSLIFGGTLIASVAATIDSFIIAKFMGLAVVAVFGLAQYAANLVQVPQRSIQSISAGVLSRAWKDKNMVEIERIYQRSCINLLLIALFIFGNIWLNVYQGIQVLHIQKEYEGGMGVIFILGMVRIIDAGTGLNNMVINTSTYWKFDFYSGIILLACRLPLTYFLIKNYGIIGSAFAELAAFSLYNYIRFEFLRRKFKMQPFNSKTIYALLLGFVIYGISYLLFDQIVGWLGIIIRTLFFSTLFSISIIYWKLTPDAGQLVVQIQDRFKKST
ncbi:MAG: polysaccharide biosynthesis C-terminal domain-containing protein [Bacteroidetes bacterium]|nr:polysaccharide biosynthesis C-terminal domain-containing protein [Bacteroidota bacterium]